MKVVSGAPQVKAFEKCYGLSTASLGAGYYFVWRLHARVCTFPVKNGIKVKGLNSGTEPL